jgi:hypothetical protein
VSREKALFEIRRTTVRSKVCRAVPMEGLALMLVCAGCGGSHENGGYIGPVFLPPSARGPR